MLDLGSRQMYASLGFAPALRVGYVVKRYPRFSETFVVNEILAHERAGVEIDVFSLRTPTDAHFQDKLAQVRAAVAYLPEGNCRLSDFWEALGDTQRHFPSVLSALSGVGHATTADLFHAVVLAHHIAQRKIDHLHAHFATSAASVARLASLITGIPYSVTAHAKDIFHEEVDPADLREKIESAAQVVTVSDFNREFLRRQYPEFAGKITRIYNGLDLSEIPYKAPTTRPAKIVAVGRLVEKKGFADLIDACALLATRGIVFDCEIIGDGELAGDLARRIAQLDLGRRVRLLGPLCRRDVLQSMQSAAVVAAPCIIGEDGNRDGLPTVLLEAMALGTPCVSTDVTGIPELVRHEKTGLIVSEHCPRELSDSIARLLIDASLREVLAAAARQLIERNFNIDRNSTIQRDIFAESRSQAYSTTLSAAGAI